MMYSSHGPTKLRIREGMMLFCRLILEHNPHAPQPHKLLEHLKGTSENGWATKLNRGLRQMLDALRASKEGLAKEAQGIRVTVNNQEVWATPNRISSVQLFWPIGGENGILLNVTRDAWTWLSFRTSKLALAQKFAHAANLPAPVGIADWPNFKSITDPDKTLSAAELLELLHGTKIPLHELVDLAQKYAGAQ